MEVFLTSPWIPPEWIRAHGLQPRGIWASANFDLGKGAFSAGVCAFAEAAVQFADTGKNCVIFMTSCDQLRRGFDAAICSRGSRSFLFNLPATWQSAAATQLFRSELERLGQFLVNIGGRAPSKGMLRQEILASSETRMRLLQAAQTTSAREFAEAVAQFHWNGSFSPLQSTSPKDKIPLALVGGPFLAPHWKWLDEMEAAGAWVAVNATETGERSLLPGVSETFSRCGEAPDEPLDTLVQGYFNHAADVFQRPNTRLYSWLKERLNARGVRGIVLWQYTGCDLWRAEAQSLKENFGVPVLLLEASEHVGTAPRELTRLQAFLEMLR